MSKAKTLQIRMDEDMLLLWDAICAMPRYKHTTHAGIFSCIMEDSLDGALRYDGGAALRDSDMFKVKDDYLYVNVLDDVATKLAGKPCYHWRMLVQMGKFPPPPCN